ncbi:hypothetical protein DEU56DRAFT_752881 [Suillus clintonianus]|uniref:uncharacterized protein n=1 Tax=Suillus clintonianus TaxID=1904413 RepID=UPI001B870DB8|nr:uncharacterized protein DEU56DRAFT_752881 [Suillus clintonianus]KAG2149229.1 hypothetical protein DEU56DRAFT_752881 [Suillus clintonianus]
MSPEFNRGDIRILRGYIPPSAVLVVIIQVIEHLFGVKERGNLVYWFCGYNTSYHEEDPVVNMWGSSRVHIVAVKGLKVVISADDFLHGNSKTFGSNENTTWRPGQPKGTKLEVIKEIARKARPALDFFLNTSSFCLLSP